MRDIILLIALFFIVMHLDDFDRIITNAAHCQAAAPAVPLVQ